MQSMEVISREAAKTQGLDRYYTAVSCANGHACERYTSTGKCCECRKDVKARYAKKKHASLPPKKSKDEIKAEKLAKAHSEKIQREQAKESAYQDRLRMYSTTGIISRSDARTLGLKQYFNGRPCAKGGHIAPRYVCNIDCVECNKDRLKGRDQSGYYDPVASAAYYIANREARLEYAARKRAENPEDNREKARNWRKANPEKKADQRKRYYERYPEKRAESNRGKNARREAAKRGALMSDRTRQDAAKERKIILSAQLVTELAGREYHTDHIVALAGRLEDGTPIFGPHVWWNLRPLDGMENMKKSNFVTEEHIRKALDNLRTSGVSADYVGAVEENLRAGRKPCTWTLPIKVNGTHTKRK